MPLAFLAPWLLAAAAFVVAPVLVHLVNRERRDPTLFPSLMFVSRVPHRAERRRRVRHPLLLALRCLALLLIAAAFARPLVGGARAAGGAAGGRELVILLDRSYSMGAGDRWARATAAARGAVDRMAAGDRATLVLFDETAAVAAASTGDRVRLRQAIDSARVGSGLTLYAPALAGAAGVLAASPLGRREILLVTDFQRRGWTGADAAVHLPAGTVLTPVDVGGPARGNVALTGADFSRDVSGGRERVTVVARVANSGDEAAAVSARLEVNGRPLETRPVQLPARGAATVTFAALPVPAGWTRATVRLAGTPAGGAQLPADDVFHLALARGQVVSVLLVESVGSRPDASLYLRRALAVGDRPPFRVDVARANALGAADLAGRSLVILNDAIPTAAGVRLLDAYVRAGGGLLALGGQNAATRPWPASAGALLPAAFGSVVDRAPQGGARLARTERSHPVFAPFSAPRSGDLASARVFRYQELAPAAGAAVVARFDDGAPALVERPLGAGRTLAWASTLDAFWGDLALQPLFVPYVHQLATHAAGYRAQRPSLTVGQTLDLALAGGSARDTGASGAGDPAAYVVRTPGGRSEAVRASGGAAPALRVVEPGFYEIEGSPGREGARVVAVNVDPAEADPARIEPAELAAAMLPGGTAAASAAGSTAARTPEEREREQGVWWYLLIGAALLLGAEMLLGNRLSEGRTASG